MLRFRLQGTQKLWDPGEWKGLDFPAERGPLQTMPLAVPAFPVWGGEAGAEPCTELNDFTIKPINE